MDRRARAAGNVVLTLSDQYLPFFRRELRHLSSLMLITRHMATFGEDPRLLVSALTSRRLREQLYRQGRAVVQNRLPLYELS